MEPRNPLALSGKRIVVTRAPEQAAAFVQQLQDLGAEVLLAPAVRYAGPADTGRLDEAVRLLGSFDWLVFTSQNAVSFFCKRCRELDVDCGGAQAAGLHVAVVGPATARKAEEEGLRVDFVSTQYCDEALGDELQAKVSGKNVLLPCSDRARGDLPASLRAAGAGVLEVVAYRTLAAEAPDGAVLEAIAHGRVDVLTFASPSAFQSFAEQLGHDVLNQMSPSVLFAAIGPTTAEAIRQAGLPVQIEATESTAEGLVRAIADYFARHARSGVSAP